MSLVEKPLRIISIEDTPSDCEIIINELAHLGREIIFSRVSDAHDLERELRARSWDLVVSDHNLPELLTVFALKLVRSVSPELPFILFSGRIGEEGVADLMKAGVEDIVMKSRPERLLPVVKRILRESEIKSKETLAKKMALEAFAAKEQMLAIVSHDIKNPLFAIQLEAQMLLRAVERNSKSLFSEEVKIQANRILKTTDRMKSLITDLLDKNKTENTLSVLHRVDVDVIKILQDALDATRPLMREKEILTKLYLPELPVVANLDRNKMFQVFTNLFNNAVKFTPPKGEIKIELSDAKEEFIFKVTDSGPGLPSESINRVFEKYWTGKDSKFPGTGLGLYICKTILAAHGGRISAENAFEAGASFSFVLPKDSCSVPHTVLGEQNDPRKKIYVVDDDEDLREVIAWALGKEGYIIHSFHCPKEALQSLQAGRDLPHLIVVDFHMDEMKGSEFLTHKNGIKALKDCPVVMISASPQEVIREVRPEYYKEVITKPIDLEGLVSNVRKHLN